MLPKRPLQESSNICVRILQARQRQSADSPDCRARAFSRAYCGSSMTVSGPDMAQTAKAGTVGRPLRTISSSPANFSMLSDDLLAVPM